jgi:hypothetical protein
MYEKHMIGPIKIEKRFYKDIHDFWLLVFYYISNGKPNFAGIAREKLSLYVCSSRLDRKYNDNLNLNSISTGNGSAEDFMKDKRDA